MRVSWAGGYLVVDHADPRIVISVALLTNFASGASLPQVTVRHPDGFQPREPSWAGAVISH